jgi:mannose-6-phosphate isomerase-like protein (cupin superfamily)
MTVDNILSTYLRLKPDSRIEKLPADETFWPQLIAGKLGDFHHEYLVTCYTYSSNWPTWEMHPNGDEIVCMISGQATMILEENGAQRQLVLAKPGDFAFVPQGTWHTCKTGTPTTMLFITAGEGTQNRPA